MSGRLTSPSKYKIIIELRLSRFRHLRLSWISHAIKWSFWLVKRNESVKSNTIFYHLHPDGLLVFHWWRVSLSPQVPLGRQQRLRQGPRGQRQERWRISSRYPCKYLKEQKQFTNVTSWAVKLNKNIQTEKWIFTPRIANRSQLKPAIHPSWTTILKFIVGWDNAIEVKISTQRQLKGKEGKFFGVWKRKNLMPQLAKVLAATSWWSPKEVF